MDADGRPDEEGIALTYESERAGQPREPPAAALARQGTTGDSGSGVNSRVCRRVFRFSFPTLATDTSWRNAWTSLAASLKERPRARH